MSKGSGYSVVERKSVAAVAEYGFTVAENGSLSIEERRLAQTAALFLLSALGLEEAEFEGKTAFYEGFGLTGLPVALLGVGLVNEDLEIMSKDEKDNIYRIEISTTEKANIFIQEKDAPEETPVEEAGGKARAVESATRAVGLEMLAMLRGERMMLNLRGL